MQIHIATTGLEEPMWLFMASLRRLDHERRFVAHPSGACQITDLILTTPNPLRSPAARVLQESAIFSYQEGPEYLLTIVLDRGLQQQAKDFRPHLPLVLQL